jgi:hypothetical protein
MDSPQSPGDLPVNELLCPKESRLAHWSATVTKCKSDAEYLETADRGFDRSTQFLCGNYIGETAILPSAWTSAEEVGDGERVRDAVALSTLPDPKFKKDEEESSSKSTTGSKEDDDKSAPRSKESFRDEKGSQVQEKESRYDDYK